jgi:hypothetical protein
MRCWAFWWPQIVMFDDCQAQLAIESIQTHLG